jgi:8-oxo-dGTP diphosphatase
MNPYIAFIQRVMAIAHTGLTYTNDPYARENYEELMSLSKTMLHEFSNRHIEPIDLYVDQRYPTPQPTVRVLLVQDRQLCLVKEHFGPAQGQWSLPGGWCDIGKSPKEAALAEGEEESGYPIVIDRILAVMDRRFYLESELHSTYTICFLAHPTGPSRGHNFEVEEVAWFDFDQLPELSFKTSAHEVQIMINAYLDGTVYFE